MDRAKLAIAMQEACRFLAKCEELPDAYEYERGVHTFTHDHYPKQSGAIRRASMDLTRALADLRKTPS